VASDWREGGAGPLTRQLAGFGVVAPRHVGGGGKRRRIQKTDTAGGMQGLRTARKF
jgi:hypothetical protein